MLSNKNLKSIANQSILVGNISNKDLIEFCIIANNKYRAGEPIISDEDYDFIFISELAKRSPEHPFLKKN